MAGATAATAAAGVTASQGSTITINLLNNYLSFGENQLNPDLTGDGHPDLTITGTKYFFSKHTAGSYRFSGVSAYATVVLNGILARASITDNPRNYVLLGSQRKGGTSTPVSLTGSIPVFFKDLRINGGVPTKGSLEVTVFGAGIRLDSLTYNTPGQGSRLAAAVPDQGSSLALLAMGAGGILALRRWRAKQAPS